MPLSIELSKKLPILARIWLVVRNFIEDFLTYVYPDLIPSKPKPSISNFSPLSGYYGTFVTIKGEKFPTKVEDGLVKIGGKISIVVSTKDNTITAIVGKDSVTGPITVSVDGITATSDMNFNILPYPAPGSSDDGPPLIVEGKGEPSQGVSSTGTLEILVSLVTPSDISPSNPANERNNVQQTWDNVKKFYEQASFNDLTVNITLTSSWATLSGDKNTYYDPTEDNIINDPIGGNSKKTILIRLISEAAQAAVDDGEDLDDYDILACCIFLDGVSIRAWGNFTNNSRFEWSDPSIGLDIDISTTNEIYLIAVDEEADWGRCAHETGHNIIDSPGKLVDGTAIGEDVYDSGLIDRTVATAERFEMMGAHDTHPLFSGFYMEQMGYYNTNNTKHIRHLNWDRNPKNETFEIVAHGLSKNNFADRCHLVKIKVSDGLFYYIEVRQRPGTTTQIFDDSIPLNGATNDGGVIVTKVYTDVVNINQQIRFISLLHEPVVLKNGETAIDPARDLTITVENEGLVARPLVCRVRVQWAQNIEDVPDGSFDLRIEPWDSDYQTPDIWIDRIPYGTFDNLLDTQGRPFDTGDKPRPNEINHFYARVHNDGADKAKNVNVTFYSVEPPGIGDNGNWGPLETKTIASIDANSHEDISSNWTPIIDRHTCLKVFIQQQLGEVQGNNNQAQENVFHFEAPASSRPKSIVMPVAVRNPLNRQTLVMINVRSVPKGYTVQFPHRWLWLNPKQEKTFNFIIILINDYWWYREKYAKNITAKINLLGRIPRSYREKIPPNVMPASRMLPIGGITVKVTPKQNVKIELKANGEHYKIHATGKIIPGLQSEVLRVDATDPYGYCRYKNCTTNSAGNFSAIIDVTEPATGNDILPPGHPHLYPIHGKYRVQARIINSPNAAQAESNIIFINFS